MTETLVKPPRILNLDEFAPPVTSFVYEGKDYPVELLSTEAYLRFLQDKDRAEGDLTDEEQALLGILMLKKVVPTFPKDKAMAMPFPQLLKLMNWIKDLLEGDSKNLDKVVKETAR